MDNAEFAKSLSEFITGNGNGFMPLFKIKMTPSQGGKCIIILDGLQELASRFRKVARSAYKSDDYDLHKVATERANQCEALYDKWNGRDAGSVVAGEIIDDSHKFAVQVFSNKFLFGRKSFDENGFTYEVVVGPSSEQVLEAAAILVTHETDSRKLN